jgi:hypothetical protein
LLLHFGRVLGFGIERDAEADAVGLLVEARHDFAAVAHAVFDQFLWHDARVGALEVEAHAAVLRFHARAEGAALAQVDAAARRVPVVAGRVPPGDVVRIAVGGPDGLDVGADGGFYGDLHAGSSVGGGRWRAIGGLSLRRRTRRSGIDKGVAGPRKKIGTV